jgi:hypothetical protein
VRRLLLALTVVAVAAFAQDTSPGDFLIHAGVCTDFVSHQPSAITGFSFKAATIGGVPTYSSTTFESSLIKTPGTSSSITITTGFLQIPYHQNHWGIYYFSNVGVTKFDVATLGNIQGGGGAYLDVGGMATKDKYHVWLSGGPRQISITSLQNKVTWMISLTTVLKKGQ